MDLQCFQLDIEGVCATCKLTSDETEQVSCFQCKQLFHVICTAASNENKWATKTMMNGFKATSTKNNFLFLLNIYLTNVENNMADAESTRIRKLERNMENIHIEMVEMKKLLIKSPLITTHDDLLRPNDESKKSEKKDEKVTMVCDDKGCSSSTADVSNSGHQPSLEKESKISEIKVYLL